MLTPFLILPKNTIYFVTKTYYPTLQFFVVCKTWHEFYIKYNDYTIIFEVIFWCPNKILNKKFQKWIAKCLSENKFGFFFLSSRFLLKSIYSMFGFCAEQWWLGFFNWQIKHMAHKKILKSPIILLSYHTQQLPQENIEKQSTTTTYRHLAA